MKNNERNIFDKFLDNYSKLEDNTKIEIIAYHRPSLVKCIFGFIFSLIFFLILLRIFTFSFMYFILFFGDLIILIYFGLNLFTARGFVIPVKYRVSKDEYEKLQSQSDESDEIDDE